MVLSIIPVPERSEEAGIQYWAAGVTVFCGLRARE